MSLLSTLQSVRSSGPSAVRATVDVSFEIRGGHLPRDYPFDLERAVFQVLPGLRDDPLAGIHRVRAPLTESGYLLSGRSRLQLRVSALAADAATALCGQALELGGSRFDVGVATVRPVLPFPTLRAAMVISKFADEQAFLDDIGMQLEVLEVRGEVMCGLPVTLIDRTGDGGQRLSGFALVLHDLSAEHSLRMQTMGMGSLRTLGCGLFVHHKIIKGHEVFPD